MRRKNDVSTLRYARSFERLQLRTSVFKSERACSVHWRALNVHQTSMFNAPGTRMELIRNVYVRRPKHAKLLENFKHVYFLSQTRTKHTPILATYSAAHRTYTKGTQRTRIAFRTGLRRALGVFGILHFFFSTRSARVSLTR